MDLFSIRIRPYYLHLLLDIRIDEVFLGYLYSYSEAGRSCQFISELEMEDIMGLKSSTMKAYILLSILSKKQPSVFKVFINALVFTNQIDLAEKIDSQRTKDLLNTTE